MYRDDIDMRIRGISKNVLASHDYSRRKLAEKLNVNQDIARGFLTRNSRISGHDYLFIKFAYVLARAELVSASVGVGHDSPSQVLSRWQRWKELQNNADV
jgi:hypothetical protein